MRKSTSRAKPAPKATRKGVVVAGPGSGPVAVVILAAGLGKRMRSELPKVLHEAAGQPLIFHLLDRVLAAAPQAEVAVVTGHGREQVEARIVANPAYARANLRFVLQPEQRGTGHAARCAMESDWGRSLVARGVPVLVLPGDTPLVPAALIAELVRPLGRGAALRLLSTQLVDPTGYGRVVRRGKSVQRIVEQKDASLRERVIREVAVSTYLFEPRFLAASLGQLSDRNAQGEYYLTDLVERAARARKGIESVLWPEAEDLRGVNDPWELAEVSAVLQRRRLRELARAGVRVFDPASIQLDASVEVASGAELHPGAILRGATRVAAGAVIGPRCVLTDVEVAEGAVLKAGTVAERSRVGARASVGPYAHLRPGSDVGEGAKIGNFVELKETRIGAGTSIAHLSYLGDAEVGARVNIGCGFVTCNFDGRVIDGRRKHRTVIEDDAFVGSDCQTVAPVRVGRGAYVASGSTVTEDVEADALAIARARQVNKPGYARRLRGN